MRIARHFTEVGRSPYTGIRFRDAAPGSHAVAFPEHWSQQACDALEQSYLCVTGVPACLTYVPEEDVPHWLWRRAPDREALSALAEDQRAGGETSARQVFDRLAGAWTYCGWKCGYFDTEDDARAFFDEIRFMLCRQMAAPDALQWRSTGLYWAYGIAPRADGCCITDYRSGKLARATGEHLPPHGAFIQDVNGDATGAGGILDLWQREARLLMDGLDTASNVSRVPDGGGNGLLRHLRVGDGAASAVVGTGTATAGPVRMITVDAGHADAMAFAEAKTAQQRSSAALASGARLLDRQADAIRDACRNRRRKGATRPDRDPALRLAMRGARAARIPDGYTNRLKRLAMEDGGDGFLAFDGGCATDPLGAAAPSGLSRHVLRIPDGVLEQADGSQPPGAEAPDDAARLWRRLAEGAWTCGGTGILFDTAANRWNTCPQSGAIRSSAAGADYLFLDDTGCGRASLNLAAFAGAEGRFDTDGLAAAVRLWTVALDISVMMTAQPTARLATRSWEFRPLGLGVANLAGLLMTSGIAYDSPEGRGMCAGITALMTATAYVASAEMARELGRFPAFEANRDDMLKVVRRHRRAAMGRLPAGTARCPDGVLGRAGRRAWNRAAELGEAFGFRNAQVTLVSHGREGALVMACDGAGIEPGIALTRFERLPGGGWRKAINDAVPRALEALGYDREQIADMVRHVVGHGTLEKAPGVNHENLRRRGFGGEALARVEAALASALDIGFVFNRWILGEDFCLRMLGFKAQELDEDGFDMLAALGFGDTGIEAANAYCCGADTMEGAPHLVPGHLAVFDCPRPQGERGRRRLGAESLIRMMAAAQPFVSGAVGHAVTLPEQATVADCQAAFRLAWRLGLKIIILDRDGAGPDPWQASAPATQDNFAAATIDTAAALMSGDMPEAARAGNGFLVYQGGLANAAAAKKPAAGPAHAKTGNQAKTANQAKTNDRAKAPAPPAKTGMSQALAIARTARALACHDTADGGAAVNRTCSEGGRSGAAPAAKTLRRSAPDAAQRTASVPSSADAVVEQRQV